MLKLYTNKRNKDMLFKIAYQNGNFPTYVSKKNASLTSNVESNEAYLYVDKENSNYYSVAKLLLNALSDLKRSYQLDVASLVNESISLKDAVQLAYKAVEFATFTLFAKHQKEEKNKYSISFYLDNNELKEFAQEQIIINQAISQTRNLQIMPENFLNSEQLAEHVVSDLQNIKNLRVKVLTKAQIRELGMNLILSVNKGSTHEPRVVVIEYTGDKSSKEKIVYVGKGITFDTGGVNTKGYHMEGMKFDMSGSVIVAYSLKSIAQLELKKNVSAVMCITDNRLDGDASLPENVYQSMSGKWVEVTDTDAEGRLVLADGLYYAADILKATTIVDVATLTGSLMYALGKVYTGIWSTDDKNWEKFCSAASQAKEKVWRMPMHKDFHKTNTSSKVADLNNWSGSSKADHNSAAMFLKEFTKDVPYIHCDVASTADVNGEPMAAMVHTLVEFAK
ncbi:M17 family metallopeptidase [Mycoplasmopsis alligatoris]|uniref:Probable cytosol aminopeptidase n=1 Tax=Mycoplasmopsis alligatoris A21JP2 TaxID=747682 RepID=D4XVG0_9BACT|nr:peptidase M17 [Mycoplasmopsis alligatoris]EFF41602.1 cytosol aminopeptidase family, catalytic domain protein [Mycoplasmopsis alligatoris A21JP2]